MIEHLASHPTIVEASEFLPEFSPSDYLSTYFTSKDSDSPTIDSTYLAKLLKYLLPIIPVGSSTGIVPHVFNISEELMMPFQHLDNPANYFPTAASLSLPNVNLPKLTLHQPRLLGLTNANLTEAKIF